MKRFRAFTLPELLCAIIIIGCCAMVAVPIVYATYTHYAASNKIKKFYATMKTVSVKAKADGFDWYDYYSAPEGINAQTFLDTYVLPFIKYQKITTDTDGNKTILFSDATSFSIKDDDAENCITFVYDINNTKNPNEPGKDEFYFNYCSNLNEEFLKKGEFAPYYTAECVDRASALNKCKNSPKFCSGFLVHDYFDFEKDYPFHVPL